MITSDLGAFVEVLGDGGLTFRTGDATEFARELGRILDDPALASILAERGRQRVIEFCDFQRMVQAHARVYKLAQS